MALDLTPSNIDTQLEQLTQARDGLQKLGNDQNVAILNNVIDAVEDEKQVFDTMTTINQYVEQVNRYERIDNSNIEQLRQLLEAIVSQCDDIDGLSKSDETNADIRSLKTTCSEYIDSISTIQNSDGLLLDESSEQALNEIKSILDELGVAYE